MRGKSSCGSYENTADGNGALGSNSGGYKNTASGSLALFSNTTGYRNTATGAEALRYSTNAWENTATGYRALYADTSGRNNTAIGAKALTSNNTGSFNTAVGHEALFSVTTGCRNVGWGWSAGKGNPTGSDNIYIGANLLGAYGENGLMRIGSKESQKKTFIAGIRGAPTGATGAVAVLIDANGQLGTINSSRRFKQDIQPMGGVRERLFALRPVTFRYKQPYEDGSKPVQYGLVAEEVAEVFPELVVYGKDSKPETVAYHVLATLLLNELHKEHRDAGALREQVSALAHQNQVQAAELAALKEQVTMLAKAVDIADKSRIVASTR